MARTRGTRDLPWRLIVVAERDTTLLDPDIVFRPASENRIADTRWIRPGKVAWDWWNFNNIFGVPLQMLADSPSDYRKEPESLAFLSAVPAVRDETRVLGIHLAPGGGWVARISRQ